MKDKFEVEWQVYDGYAGPRAPHRFSISKDHLDEDWTKDDLREFFSESLQENFLQKASPVSDDEAEFLKWAEIHIAEMKAESDAK